MIKEGKTGKTRIIDLNSSVKTIVGRRRAPHPTHTYLFEVDSNRAKGKAVSRIAVANAFKGRRRRNEPATWYSFDAKDSWLADVQRRGVHREDLQGTEPFQPGCHDGLHWHHTG